MRAAILLVVAFLVISVMGCIESEKRTEVVVGKKETTVPLELSPTFGERKAMTTSENSPRVVTIKNTGDGKVVVSNDSSSQDRSSVFKFFGYGGGGLGLLGINCWLCKWLRDRYRRGKCR